MLARVMGAAAAGRRAFSSEASSGGTSVLSEGWSGKKSVGRDTLGRRLMSLIFPKRSAVVTLRKWAEEGKALQKYQLNRVVRELRAHKRFKHALEICEWMTTQQDVKLLPGDYAVHLDLVSKVRGLSSAEKFFEDIPKKMIDQATCTSLLHSYVQHNLPTKAEALMKKMSERGYLSHPLPYNHMLTMYITTDQFEKVLPLVEELKKITSPDVFTYNLLLSICANQNDVEGAEKILLELRSRKIMADWITYSTLTNIYISGGHLEKARDALKEMEKLVSRKSRVAFASLITLHTNLSNKDGVYKTWKKMGLTFRKMNDAEYMSMISSLVKLGDVGEAEKLYNEWESVSGTRDSRIPNILLQVYIKEDSMDKAEKFHEQMAQKNFVSTYITWETLALGYMSTKNTAKVLECMKKGLSSLKKWDPNEKIVRQVFEELEEKGDIKGAEEFLVILRDAGHVTTEIYKSLLRTYANAGKMPPIVAERMEKDKVELDEETHRLIRTTSKLCVSEVSNILS